MKKKISKNLSIVIIAFLIVPQVTFAAWWNPLSWGFWSIFRPTPQVNQIKLTNTASTTPRATATKEIDTNDKEVTKNKKEEIRFQKKTVVEPVLKKDQTIEQKIETPKETQGTIQKAPEQPIPPSVSIQAQEISPSVVAIDTFLANPTLENFKTFCNTSKTILLRSQEQRKVLNTERTDFVMENVPITLYEKIRACDLALYGEFQPPPRALAPWKFRFVVYNPNDVFQLEPGDSDVVREVKINFNKGWEKISTYKLVGFQVFRKDIEQITPKLDMEWRLAHYYDNATLSKYVINDALYPGYILPEKVLVGIRNSIIKGEL